MLGLVLEPLAMLHALANCGVACSEPYSGLVGLNISICIGWVLQACTYAIVHVPRMID